MKNVLLLSGRDMLPAALIDFACALHAESPIRLTGLFLPEATYQDMLWYYTAGAIAPVLDTAPIITPVTTPEIAAATFKQICLRNGIGYSVRKIEGQKIAEQIKKETRFADLLLLSNDSFDENQNDALSGGYTGDTLHDSECPVIMVPKIFHQPQNIILAYDGSPSSVYAIKQFALTFPAMTRLDTLLFYMHQDKEKQLPDEQLVEPLIAGHFAKHTIFKANIDSAKHVAPWLDNQSATLLVTGAFGRNAVSRAFHSSFIQDIITAGQLSIFVAHK